MKSKNVPIHREGAISLEIDPKDPIAWKFSMLFEAASSTRLTVEDVANKYGYTREHFYVLKKQYEEGGCQALQDKAKGPKSNHVRSEEVEKQIILHRFLDPEANCAVISQKMNQAGLAVSQRSVERTINKYGLQKKGYIKQLKKQRGSP